MDSSLTSAWVGDEVSVRARLAGMTNPVALLLFVRSMDAPDTVAVTRGLLAGLTRLSHRVTVEEVDVLREPGRAVDYGITHIPAIVVTRNGADTGIRFLGAPVGHERGSLVDAIVLAAGPDSGLSVESRRLIAAHPARPLDIQVFVTPTCAHCPGAVRVAHRIARERAGVRATCIEAMEFLDLSRQFRVTGVPKTVVNGTLEILGALPEEAFVRAVLGDPDDGAAARIGTAAS